MNNFSLYSANNMASAHAVVKTGNKCLHVSLILLFVSDERQIILSSLSSLHDQQRGTSRDRPTITGSPEVSPVVSSLQGLVSVLVSIGAG